MPIFKINLTIAYQKYDGQSNFATDAWTSPNHKAFIAVSMHLEHEGNPLAMILDIVEVAEASKYNTYPAKSLMVWDSVSLRRESCGSI
jgi:hypothetical protein